MCFQIQCIWCTEVEKDSPVCRMSEWKCLQQHVTHHTKGSSCLTRLYHVSHSQEKESNTVCFPIATLEKPLKLSYTYLSRYCLHRRDAPVRNWLAKLQVFGWPENSNFGFLLRSPVHSTYNIHSLFALCSMQNSFDTLFAKQRGFFLLQPMFQAVEWGSVSVNLTGRLKLCNLT